MTPLGQNDLSLPKLQKQVSVLGFSHFLLGLSIIIGCVKSVYSA